jgi:membrane protease YdiL (CAAX protease family)
VAGVFTALILLHVLRSAVLYLRDRRRISPEPTPRPRWRWSSLLHIPMFYLACFYAYREGVFTRQLVNPLYIGLGLAAGHLVFGLSLVLTMNALRDAWGHFIDFESLWRYVTDNPVVLGRFLLVGLSEEMVWRVAAQPIFTGHALALIGSDGWRGTAAVVVAILVVALLFSLAHRHFYTNSATVSLEFYAFAILLGVLYHWTASFTLVVVIHALRDVEIAYLEYLIKVEELGDEELAAREVEQSVLQAPRAEHS